MFQTNKQFYHNREDLLITKSGIVWGRSRASATVWTLEVGRGLFVCAEKTGADKNIFRRNACAWQVRLRDNKTGHELLGGDDRVAEGSAVAR